MSTVYPPVAPGHSTVAIDFDGVLAENTWPSPEVGEPIEAGLKMAKHYHELGYEIVVYTARPESHRPLVEDFFFQQNMLDVIYDVVFAKPRAGLYIDDRAHKFTKPVVTEIRVHTDECDLTKKGRCSCDGGCKVPCAAEGDR